jgi:hypothetical protein
MMKSGWFLLGSQEPQGEQATETYIFLPIFYSVFLRNGFVIYMCHVAWVYYPVITNIREVWTEIAVVLNVRFLNFVC